VPGDESLTSRRRSSLREPPSGPAVVWALAVYFFELGHGVFSLIKHCPLHVSESVGSCYIVAGKNIFFRSNAPPSGTGSPASFDTEILGWSPSSIFENELDSPITIYCGIRGNITDHNPSLFICPEIVVGLLNGLFGFAQQTISEVSINNDSYQSEELNPKCQSVIAISSFVVGAIMMWWGLGWFHSRQPLPKGLFGEFLAVTSLVCGIILCFIGAIGITNRTLQF
jgi:hypothetical protein